MEALQSRVAEAASFLKKLSNPDRLLIVCALVEGEASVRTLEDRLGIRQPGLSQQLAELRNAGMITGRKAGKQMFYALSDPKAREIVSTMHRMFCQTDVMITERSEE